MLRLTKRIEYGLMALKHISDKPEGQISPAKDIADCTQIPRELLAKVLQQLNRAGMIRSIQGPKGGYILSCSLARRSLADFIVTIEGEHSLVECASGVGEDCNLVDCCNVRTPLLRINQQLKQFLEKITLEEIISDNSSASPSYGKAVFVANSV